MDVVTPKLNLGGQLVVLVRWCSFRVVGLPSSCSATGGVLLTACTLGLAALRFTFLLLIRCVLSRFPCRRNSQDQVLWVI